MQWIRPRNNDENQKHLDIWNMLQWKMRTLKVNR